MTKQELIEQLQKLDVLEDTEIEFDCLTYCNDCELSFDEEVLTINRIEIRNYETGTKYIRINLT